MSRKRKEADAPVTGSAAQEETETAAAQDAAAQQPETAAQDAQAEAEQETGQRTTPQRTWLDEKVLAERFICEVVSLIHVHEIFSDALETETE